MKKNIFTAFLIGLISQVAFSQAFDKAKLDSYFDVLEANNKFMGSVAISQNNKIIYTKSVGYVDIANNVKANENSKYRIGSISKTFTAVLVLKAIEKKVLDLNQTIDKFFPTIENANKITVKHLLLHRSGLYNFTDNENYLDWNTKAKSEKEMIDIIIKGGIDFEPDSKASYSNSNYVLLTYILEKSFKKTYAELLDKYIVKPLKLKNTGLGSKIKNTNNECLSYKYKQSWGLESETDMSIPVGAGAVISTASDLVKFGDALFSGKLLKKESLELMKTIKEGYGIGLFEIPFYNKMSYGHTGGIDGFRSVFSNFPEEKISFALTSNGQATNQNNIAVIILSAVFNEPYEIPTFKTYEVKPEDLQNYTGLYTTSEIPLEINITQEGTILMAQATGQDAIPLTATDKDEFQFDAIGLVLKFNTTEKSMMLKQNGMTLNFIKK